MSMMSMIPVFAPRPSLPSSSSSSSGKLRGCLDYLFGASNSKPKQVPLILPTDPATATEEHDINLVSSQGGKGGDHVAITLERLARLEQVSKMICGDELRQVPDRVRLGIEAELRLADYQRLVAGGGAAAANWFLVAETQAHLSRMESQLKSAYEELSARLRAAEVKSRRKNENGLAASTTSSTATGLSLPSGPKSAAAAATATALCLGDAPPTSHGAARSFCGTNSGVSAPASDVAAAASLETVGSCSLPPDPGEVGGGSMQSSSRTDQDGTAPDSFGGSESVSLEVNVVAPELEVPRLCIQEGDFGGADSEILPIPSVSPRGGELGGDMQPGSTKNLQENSTLGVAGEEKQGAGSESMKLAAPELEAPRPCIQEEEVGGGIGQDRDQERIEKTDAVVSSSAALLSKLGKKVTVDLALIAASNAEEDEERSTHTNSPSSILSPTDRRTARRRRGKRSCNSSSPSSPRSLSPAKPSPKSVSSSSTKSSPKSVSSSSSTTPAAPRRENTKSVSPNSSFRPLVSGNLSCGSKQHDKPSSFAMHKTCAGAARVHVASEAPVPWRY